MKKSDTILPQTEYVATQNATYFLSESRRKPIDIGLAEFFAPFRASGDDLIFFRTFDESGFGKKYASCLEDVGDDTTAAELGGWNRSGGVYFVVNAGGNRDKRIKTYVAAFVENDVLSVEEQHKRLDSAPLPPSIRVETRKSVHAYWLLTPGCSKDDWKQVQCRLIAYFDGDPAIKNASRVMRVPGFDHLKLVDGVLQRKPVECVEFEPERRYSIEELLKAFPAVGTAASASVSQPTRRANLIASAPQREKSISWKPGPDGSVAKGNGRNNYLTSVVGKLRRYEDFSREAALAATLLVNEEKCQPPLDEDEVEGIVNSVYKKLAEVSIEDEQQLVENFGGGLDEIEEYADEEPEYVIHGLELAELGGIFAQTNVGKSCLARNVAIKKACGGEFLSPLVEAGKPTKVLIFNFEGGRRRFYREMSKMIEALDEGEREHVRTNLRFVLHDKHRYKDQPLSFNNAAHRTFAAEIIKRFGAELVFIDTMTTAFTFKNENDNAEWQQYTKWLEEMAVTSGAAIVFVHHEGKRSESDGNGSAPRAHRGRGGSASAQIAQLILNLENRTKDGKDYVVLGFGKLKDEPEPDIAIEHTSERWFKQSDVLPQNQKSQYDLMLDSVPAGLSVTRKDLADLSGLSYDKVKRLVKRALRENPPKLLEKAARLMRPQTND